MKQILLLAAALGAYLTSGAQVGLLLGGNVAGYTYSYKGVSEDRSSVIGPNAGVMLRIRPLHRWIGEPSLTYTRKGARNMPDGAFGIDYIKNKLDYVQLSLPVLYRQPLSFLTDVTIGAGPYLSYLVNASRRTHYTDGADSNRNIVVGASAGSELRRYDAGLRLAGGLHAGRWVLSFNYDLGLMNISPAADQKIKTRTFGTSLVLFF